MLLSQRCAVKNEKGPLDYLLPSPPGKFCVCFFLAVFGFCLIFNRDKLSRDFGLLSNAKVMQVMTREETDLMTQCLYFVNLYVGTQETWPKHVDRAQKEGGKLSEECQGKAGSIKLESLSELG